MPDVVPNRVELQSFGKATLVFARGRAAVRPRIVRRSVGCLPGASPAPLAPGRVGEVPAFGGWPRMTLALQESDQGFVIQIR